MKVVLSNFGTTGDIRPFLALGKELAHGQHHVTFALSPQHGDYIRSLGFDFKPLGPELTNAQNEINSAWIRGANLNVLQDAFRPLRLALPGVFEDLRIACARCDVLVAGPAVPVGRMVHELTGMPFVSIQVSHFGGIGSPVLRELSRWLINPFRISLGLPTLSDPLTVDANSPQLSIYAMSRHLRRPCKTWDERYHLTGFFFFEEPDWLPDEYLTRFINEKNAPVVMTLGSMPHHDLNKIREIFSTALSVLGLRGIFQTSHALSPAASSHVLTIGHVPHAWLFPRSSCIIHHGGAGTAAAAFRSTIPSIFVPHGEIFDQAYWAMLAREVGCAPQALPIDELNVDLLVERLREVQRVQYHDASRVLGFKVRSESGVRGARRLIEEFVLRLAGS